MNKERDDTEEAMLVINKTLNIIEKNPNFIGKAVFSLFLLLFWG